jgi:hypothetical protein
VLFVKYTTDDSIFLFQNNLSLARAGAPTVTFFPSSDSSVSDITMGEDGKNMIAGGCQRASIKPFAYFDERIKVKCEGR